MTKDEVIETLSDLRAKYNCFDEKEEPYYKALCIAIKSVRIAENMKKAIPMDWIEQWEEKNPYAELGDMLNDWKDESEKRTCSGN